MFYTIYSAYQEVAHSCHLSRIQSETSAIALPNAWHTL